MAATYSNAAGLRVVIVLLPKPRRLTKKREFEQVFKFGSVIETPLVRLIWKEGEGKAAVTTAKTLGSIAYRNGVKRRWREALRLILNESPAGIDFVLLVKAQGAKTEMPERQAELKAAFGKVIR